MAADAPAPSWDGADSVHGSGTRAHRRGHRHLLAGSAALVAGAAVQAVTGAVFWLVAARIDTTDDVGRATALFTSVLFVAYLGGLGLQVSLARYAPGRDHDSHVVFSWGVLAITASSAVVGGCYLLVVDTGATHALLDRSPLAGSLLFITGCVGAAVTLVVDVRWMTVRRWSLVLIRITAVGLLRFPLLLLPDGDADAVHLFAVAVAPLVVTAAIGLVTMPKVTGGRHRLRPLPETLGAALRYSGVNYLSTLTYQAPQFVLPVIVLLSVDPDTNAAFYVAWGITSIAFYVPTAIGQALLAEAGKDGAELRAQVRVALIGTTTLMAVGALVATIGRDVVTAVYGDDYREATRILPALVGAGIPWAITSVFLTEARALHRHLATVAITGALTAAILVPAVVLVPDDGIDGAAQAFLLGNMVAAVVAAGAHVALRGRPADPVHPAEAAADDLTLHP